MNDDVIVICKHQIDDVILICKNHSDNFIVICKRSCKTMMLIKRFFPHFRSTFTAGCSRKACWPSRRWWRPLTCRRAPASTSSSPSRSLTSTPLRHQSQLKYLLMDLYRDLSVTVKLTLLLPFNGLIKIPLSH